MPVIHAQLGASGQLCVNWIPAYQHDPDDGRSTQPSFQPPEGNRVYSNGKLTEVGRDKTKRRCTCLAPVIAKRFYGDNPEAQAQADQEKDRLLFLASVGEEIRESRCIPYENYFDVEDPL